MASRDKSSPTAASREDSGAEWDALLPGATEDVDEDEDLGSVEASPFDAAIDRIGFGRAQMYVLLACGMANAADSVELAAVSFVITTTMECDLELSASDKGWLVSATFIGMMFGGWLWGQWSDKYGRKRTLVIALALNSSAAIGCALATSFIELVMYRAICGLGIGGSIPILFSFYSEFTPSAQRGKSVTVLAASWMLGAIIVAILAYVILSPSECARNSNDGRSQEAICADQATQRCGLTTIGTHEWDSWRVFLIACTCPAILAMLLVAMQHESPRWLLLNGYIDEAEVVLGELARVNGTSDSGWAVMIRPDVNTNSATIMSPSSAVGPGSGRASVTNQGSGVVEKGPTQRTFRDALRDLSEPPLLRRMILLCGVWFFLSFGFYGFSLWLPTFYKSGGVDDDTDIYLVSIWVGLSNLPGNMFSYLMVDRIGRKWTLVVSLLLSGVAVFIVLAITSTTGVVAFSCVFAAVSVSAWNALDVIVVELFPTMVRSTAFGIQAAVGRIGSICSSLVFGQFPSEPAVPMTVVAISLFIAATCCLSLPHTGRGTAMH